MRIAVLSSGPSLRAAYTGGGHDLRIGVNRAAEMFACDWFCAGDWQYIEVAKPLGTPALFTIGHSADYLDVHGPKFGRVLRWHEAQRDDGPHPGGWATYSGTAALVLAAHLGASVIDVYGVDMAGKDDCRNTVDTAGREPIRWRDELSIWTALVAWLNSRAVRVIRHQPAEVAA